MTKTIYNFMYRHFATKIGFKFNIWNFYQKMFKKEWIKSLKLQKDHKGRSGTIMNFSMSGSGKARATSEIEREYYSKETLQPFSSDGKINKDFLKVYGDNFYKSKGYNDKQIHNN